MTTNLSSSSPTTGMSTTSYPIQNHISYRKFTPTYSAYLTAISQIPIPYTFQQAAPHPQWFQAMKAKILALEENHTWNLVLRLKNQHVVDCKWLFKVNITLIELWNVIRLDL